MPKKQLNDRLIRSLKTEKLQEDFWDKNFSGGSFGLRVSSAGRKTFVVIYRANGRRRRATLGTYPAVSLADARVQAFKLIAEAAGGRDLVGERKSTQTFAELAHLYLERYAKVYKKPKSVGEDERILKADILPVWRDRKIGEIQRRDVIELLDSIAFGRNALVMANRVRALVSKIFNFALSRDLLQFNPCHGLPPPPKERSRQRVLADEEVQLLWDRLENWPRRKPEVRPTLAVYKLILLTAQRPGEVKAMRWDELEGDLWTIPEEKTKNGREHKVPLSQQALKLIEELRPISGDSEWVCKSRLGGYVYWLQKMNGKLQEQVGFHFTPHDLRRTAATNLSKLGVDDVLIARILNHSWADRQVTSVYNRWSKLPEMREAIEKWGRRLEVIVKGETAKVVFMR